MIWNSEPDSSPTRSALAQRIVTDIQAVCGTHSGVGESHLWEAANGVAAFLEKRNVRWDSAAPQELLNLVSRALGACGESALARRLLLFGAGVVRRASWDVAGTDSICLLDLDRLTAQRGDCLEIVLFRSVHLVLETIADIWDPSSGNGVLGLQHVTSSSRAILGPVVRKRRREEFARELRWTCAGKLDNFRAQRAWETSPLVMNLGT